MATTLLSKGLIAVSDKIILAARPHIELVNLFVSDFSVENGKQYQTIDVNVIKGAVAQFAAGSNNYTKGTMGEVNFAKIALEKDSLAKWSFVDKDFLEDEFRPDWAKLGPAAGMNLGKDFVTTIMSKLTYDKADSQQTLAASVAAATLADFVGLWKICNDAGYDPATTVLVLEPTAYLRLKTLAEYKATGVKMVDIAQALGALLGFKAVVVAPNCSKVSGAAESGVSPTKGVGFLVPENAVGVASRVKQAAKEGGNLLEFGITTDEETGISISTRVVANTDDGEYVWNAECLYGAALMKQTLTIGGESVANKAPGIVQIVTE